MNYLNDPNLTISQRVALNIVFLVLWISISLAIGAVFILFMQRYLDNEKTSGLLLVFLPFMFILGAWIAYRLVIGVVLKRLKMQGSK